MSSPDPLFDPENVLPEDIDGEEVDRLYAEEKEGKELLKDLYSDTRD